MFEIIETLVPNVSYKDRKRYFSKKRYLSEKRNRSWGKKKKKTDITFLESLSSYASCKGKQKGGVPKGSLYLYFSLFKLKGRWKLSKIIVDFSKGPWHNDDWIDINPANQILGTDYMKLYWQNYAIIHSKLTIFALLGFQIKGTLVQIWKSANIFIFIWK